MSKGGNTQSTSVSYPGYIKRAGKGGEKVLRGLFNGEAQGNLMPSLSWWNSMAPQILEGLYGSYEMGSENLLEQMQMHGGMGSPGGGMSGAAGSALGSYWSDAARNVGTQAWQMSQPGMFLPYQIAAGAAGLGGSTGSTTTQNTSALNSILGAVTSIAAPIGAGYAYGSASK